MSVEEQVLNTRQSLHNVAFNVTQLTKTLVSKMVESSVQLYVNSKLRLLSSIGSLPEGAIDIQEAWEEMKYELKRAGLAFVLEENDSETRNKVSKKTINKTLGFTEGGTAERGRRKKEP